MLSEDLEFYISYGAKEEILNTDNEQCVKKDSTLTCYVGIVIYDLDRRILIDDMSFSGEDCIVMVRDKRGYNEPLEITRMRNAINEF
jgi:hypothetical protein